MQKIKSFKEFLISIFVEFTLQILFIFAGLIYLAYVFIGIGSLLLCLPADSFSNGHQISQTNEQRIASNLDTLNGNNNSISYKHHYVN